PFWLGQASSRTAPQIWTLDFSIRDSIIAVKLGDSLRSKSAHALSELRPSALRPFWRASPCRQSEALDRAGRARLRILASKQKISFLAGAPGLVFDMA